MTPGLLDADSRRGAYGALVALTLIWGMKDGALSSKVALKSSKDAGREVEWRPLPGVGHFVDLEAADKLALEIRRVLKD